MISTVLYGTNAKKKNRFKILKSFSSKAFPQKLVQNRPKCVRECFTNFLNFPVEVPPDTDNIWPGLFWSEVVTFRRTRFFFFFHAVGAVLSSLKTLLSCELEPNFGVKSTDRH